MKSTLILRMAFLGLFLISLSVFAPNELSAQATDFAPSITDAPKGNFLAPAAAIIRLTQEIETLEGFMQATLVTPTVKLDYTIKIDYYTNIRHSIESGKGVAESIGENAANIKLGGAAEYPALIDYKNQAIELLKA